VYSNRGAEDVHGEKDGITVSSSGVRLRDATDNTRLQGLITRAMPGQPASGSVGGVMSVPRPSGRQPYAIFVTPISGEYPALSSVRPAVCVMITDPERRRPSLANSLRVLFGLTDAEARLADMLACGVELRAAASKLDITYGTARARLAEIFQKTNTHRQGELVSLILAIAATD
jgi:DNA-binding CsgD family transcriptional regulator